MPNREVPTSTNTLAATIAPFFDGWQTDYDMPAIYDEIRDHLQDNLDAFELGLICAWPPDHAADLWAPSDVDDTTARQAFQQAFADIDLTAIARAHELPISTAAVPGCPAWCTRDKGHEYEDVDVLGNDVGVHEGQIGAVDSGAGTIELTLVQRVVRHPDQTITLEDPFVTLTSPDDGADFTNPHTLRDLGDAIRTAAGKLEQIGQR